MTSQWAIERNSLVYGGTVYGPKTSDDQETVEFPNNLIQVDSACIICLEPLLVCEEQEGPAQGAARAQQATRDFFETPCTQDQSAASHLMHVDCFANEVGSRVQREENPITALFKQVTGPCPVCRKPLVLLPNIHNPNREEALEQALFKNPEAFEEACSKFPGSELPPAYFNSSIRALTRSMCTNNFDAVNHLMRTQAIDVHRFLTILKEIKQAEYEGNTREFFNEPLDLFASAKSREEVHEKQTFFLSSAITLDFPRGVEILFDTYGFQFRGRNEAKNLIDTTMTKPRLLNRSTIIGILFSKSKEKIQNKLIREYVQDSFHGEYFFSCLYKEKSLTDVQKGQVLATSIQENQGHLSNWVLENTSFTRPRLVKAKKLAEIHKRQELLPKLEKKISAFDLETSQ